jgi:hypothetical protein
MSFILDFIAFTLFSKDNLGPNVVMAYIAADPSVCAR